MKKWLVRLEDHGDGYGHGVRRLSIASARQDGGYDVIACFPWNYDPKLVQQVVDAVNNVSELELSL